MERPFPEPRVVPVRGELAEAVHAICATEAFLERPERLSEDALEQVPELREGVRDLARSVVLRALGKEGAPSVAEVRASAGAQVEALRDLAGDAGPPPFPPTLDAVPREWLGEAGVHLREAGLEYAEHEALLGFRDEDGLVFFAAPVTPAQSYVWLLGPMYERIEAWLENDELLSLERMAARWWFMRWTPSRRLEEHEFARGVREQEFALAARPFLGVDDRTAVEFLADTGELDDFPPKQRHMAMQLRASVAGLWEVAERDGASAVFRFPLDGERFRVTEHAPEHDYGPGMLAVGRLIPFGDGTWLRSPGMLLLPPPETGGVRPLAQALADDTGGTPLEAKLEMMVTTLVARTKLPRRLLPAPGTREAAEILEVAVDLLREAGMGEEVPPGEIPPEVEPSKLPSSGALYGFQLDVVMAEWLAELTDLARKGEARRKRREGRTGKAKKKRGGRGGRR